MVKQARYLVTGEVFVNGSYFKPRGEDIYVYADEGLEGPSLKLVPEADAAAADADAKAKADAAAAKGGKAK